jgi:hypothetical protein
MATGSNDLHLVVIFVLAILVVPSMNRSCGGCTLPATLPLFATGLGGLGLLGWRRKKKAAA